MSIVIDEQKLREIIHDEVPKTVRELLEEFELMMEKDFIDREEAIGQFRDGKSVDWDDYKRGRNIQ
ncbi:hypothetical protein J7K99_06460 [bacterium]|nr:hypothetical protein [bacterium]